MLRSISIVLVAVFSLALVAPASAQDGQAQSGIVAVLDLAKIFELHPRHAQKMQELQTQADKMKADFQKEQASLQQRAKEAATTFEGAKLDQVEIDLRKDEVELQTRARQAQNELLKKEAEAYYSTYQEVMNAVRAVADHYNVSVVLRYDDTPIDPQNPGTVIRGVQRTVVYTNADLTPAVMKVLKIEDKPSVASQPQTNRATRNQ